MAEARGHSSYFQGGCTGLSGGVLLLRPLLEEVSLLHEHATPEEEQSAKTVDGHCGNEVSRGYCGLVEEESAHEVHQCPQTGK